MSEAGTILETRPAGRDRILVVDDEICVLGAIKALLGDEPVDVTVAESSEKALTYLGENRFAVILSDQCMPGMSGVSLLEQARSISPDSVRIMVTAYDDLGAAADGINQGGIWRFIRKPWDNDEMLHIIRQAVGQYRLVMERQLYKSFIEWQNQELRDLNKELMETRKQEMEIGARIQNTLLLEPPAENYCGFRTGAKTVPSQRVDGDFYDFHFLDEFSMDVVIGDVMGKGVPAALLGAATKNQFLKAINQLLCKNSERRIPEPCEIVTFVHKSVTGHLIQFESFVTACYARFDLKREEIVFVNCGHAPVIHYQRCLGECRLLEQGSMPLGFSAAEEYGQYRAPAAKGDIFCFYSDGLTDVRNGSGECFGIERLMQSLRKGYNECPRKAIDIIYDDLLEFAQSSPFPDDATCIIVEICRRDSEAGDEGVLTGILPSLARFSA